MWGMGNRREPKGPNDSSERALFRELTRSEEASGHEELTEAKVEAPRRSGASRRWSLAMAGVVLAALFVFVVVSGAVLAPSKFEGNDGNMAVNTAGNTDWANTPGLLPTMVERRAEIRTTRSKAARSKTTPT